MSPLYLASEKRSLRALRLGALPAQIASYWPPIMVSLVKPPVDASSESEERKATETENVGLSAFTESFFCEWIYLYIEARQDYLQQMDLEKLSGSSRCSGYSIMPLFVEKDISPFLTLAILSRNGRQQHIFLVQRIR